MCGIVGYVGEKDSAQLLIDGLKRLEYRGYDSAGIAVQTLRGVEVVKAKGRIANLEERLSKAPLCGKCGIGHTRWATHGEPSDKNSHPHTGMNGRVTLVHNGIIENYLRIKEELIAQGYSFKSETDTEAAVNLIDSLYDGDPVKAIFEAVKRIRGSFAFGVIFSDKPDTLYAIRKDSPLIIGVGKGENFIASDIPAILKWTREYIVLGEGELGIVTKNEIRIINEKLEPVPVKVQTVIWDYKAAEKGGYEHFMLKEIHEQPKALRDTISPRIKGGYADFTAEGLSSEYLKGIERIHIVACGSAMHAGYIGKTAIERLARIPVEVDIASEFRYRDPLIDKSDLVIIISQSGETADTLAALRLAKAKGAKTAAIVNVVGSSIAREADVVLYTWAGPEIAVATTKAYSAQVAMMYMLALHIAHAKGRISDEQAAELSSWLLKLPDAVAEIIPAVEGCGEIVENIARHEHLFYIGRGLDYSVSLEGSLKLKEISYIHSEAYAAGELKHGTISLIEQGTPVIAIATQKDVYEKMISNIKEVKARGAYVILLCRQSADAADVADYIIRLPDFPDMLMASMVVVVCQIIAYKVAVARGCDVDKPRNLAKSVTVE